MSTFHLGLCMAGSISAGAYTAGVVDYLMEALENWARLRDSDPSLPSHRVEVDLLGGSSGGGITAAMAFFAFRDKVQHAVLEEDGRTYNVDPDKNIFWKSWVELTGPDVFRQMLQTDDIKDYHIPSAMNAGFIDAVAARFADYISSMKETSAPAEALLSKDAELFMTLFNVTGMKYQMQMKSMGAPLQYVSEHRDLAHFRWSDVYENDGRLEISLKALHHLPQVLEAAMATGAFPVGLKARPFSRKAKYIWDNPFFQKNGKFNQQSIGLGKSVKDREDVYRSLNGDGGTSNNEPVELMRDLMLQIRYREHQQMEKLHQHNRSNDTKKRNDVQKHLDNYSIILIDPFPSYDFEIGEVSDHLLSYALELVFAMNSQLQFDAKQAHDAYNRESYGLHLIAPSRKGVAEPGHAIACGSLGGFGGFLNREYRVHDFFLGRHNCQSFLRKYFVVNLDEKPGTEDYACVEAVLQGYANEAAVNRYAFIDDEGRRMVPIIPDVTLTAPIELEEVTNDKGVKEMRWKAPGSLPHYKMELPSVDFLDGYENDIEKRVNVLLNNLYDSNWFVDLIVKIIASRLDNKIAAAVVQKIKADLTKRKLVV